MQNLLKMFFLSEVVGNNQSRFFSSTPCGKKATTSSRSLALGGGVEGIEEGVSWLDVDGTTCSWGGREGEGNISKPIGPLCGSVALWRSIATDTCRSPTERATEPQRLAYVGPFWVPGSL